MADITLRTPPADGAQADSPGIPRRTEPMPQAFCATYWLAMKTGRQRESSCSSDRQPGIHRKHGENCHNQGAHVRVTTVNGHPATEMGDYVVVPAAPEKVETDENKTTVRRLCRGSPEGWAMPTKSIVANWEHRLQHARLEGATMYRVTKLGLQCIPHQQIIWLADEVPGKPPTHTYNNITMNRVIAGTVS